jgi:hypothetical protein
MSPSQTFRYSCSLGVVLRRVKKRKFGNSGPGGVMHSNPGRRAAVLVLLVVLTVIRHAAAADQEAIASPPGGSQDTAAQRDTSSTALPSIASAPPGAPHITSLLLAPSGQPANDHLALNDKLAVVVEPLLTHPAGQYVLFLNDTEVKGLPPADYTTLQNGKRALVFKLVRNADNGAFWRELLGSPKGSRVHFAVGLGERAQPCVPSAPCNTADISIRGIDAPKNPVGFDFVLISWGRFALAAALVVGAVVLIWGHARSSTTLRDNLLPQLSPRQQTYSLGRWQMAFWFVLIFASFVFLYLLLWDYNTVSTQALALMGISGATALAAVAVDAAKDSPADAVNRALQALGLYTYADVLRIDQELNDRKAEIPGAQKDFDASAAAGIRARQAAAAAADDTQLARSAADADELARIAQRRLAQLQTEIQDRLNIKRAYADKTKPFVSQGWLKDLITDINGPALHRIQVLCWTVVLGIVFIIGVYRELAMPPDFSATLLALMGISGAGYVGFKWPEKNS